jgi:hypothetical protein
VAIAVHITDRDWPGRACERKGRALRRWTRLSRERQGTEQCDSQYEPMHSRSSGLIRRSEPQVCPGVPFRAWESRCRRAQCQISVSGLSDTVCRAQIAKLTRGHAHSRLLGQRRMRCLPASESEGVVQNDAREEWVRTGVGSMLPGAAASFWLPGAYGGALSRSTLSPNRAAEATRAPAQVAG